MATALEIRDGAPHWWLSPDIWVVPGSDPGGAPGIPSAGSSAYVWARVHNVGTVPVVGARVDFWWADPSAQILRSNAHPIGSAFADVAPGGQAEVLCLAPWAVQLVNGGHECLIAAVSYPGSSVPTPAPDDFGPTLYREVAQRNIDVIVPSMMAMPRMIAIGATGRRAKRVRITAEPGGELDRAVLAGAGLGRLRPAGKCRVSVRLSEENSCEPSGEAKLDVTLEPGMRKAVFAHVAAEGIGPGEYALVHILEHDREQLLGGCSLVVLGEDHERSAK